MKWDGLTGDGDDDDGDDDDDGYYYDYYDDDEDDYDYYDDQNISQIKPSKNCLIINHGKVWRVVTTYWGVIKNNNAGACHIAILANTTVFCGWIGSVHINEVNLF